MRTRFPLAAVGLAVLLAVTALDGRPAVGGSDQALPSGFETRPVLRTSETRDGEPFAFPRTDRPEITSVIGTIQPNGRTPRHQHPVPVYVYILEGQVELVTDGGEPRRYRSGEAYIESLNRNHQLFNKGNAAARLLVVFVGEKGKPTTVAAK